MEHSVNQPIQGIQVMRSPYYGAVFGNMFSFKLSPTDFCLTIGNNEGLPGGAVQVMQEEVAVMMVLPQLKILSEHLASIVQAVEKQIGVIKIPSKSKVTEEMIKTLTGSSYN